VGFSSYSDIDPAKIHYGISRKVLVAANAQFAWYDDSMIGPVPGANLYADAPLGATALTASRGLRHWQAHSSHSEHLLEWFVSGAGGSDGPMTFMLNDHILYYPFIDCESGDQQDMDNTVTLPRETTGAGVRAFIVCQQLGTVDGAYEISYTNQAGTSGRVVTGTVRAGAQASQLLTSALTTGAAHNPWIPLASGDNGIRQIDSITWTTPPGGLAAIVLAKPIASIIQPETTTYTEKTFHPRMPRIHNEACLMMLRAAGNSPSAGRSYFSQITTIKS
jgi:hypothetical protein